MTRIELETDGTFTGSTLKLDGEPVADCAGFSFVISPLGLTTATVVLTGAEIKFTGELKEQSRREPL